MGDGSSGARRAAWYALAVLTSINLVNYIDRYLMAAVLESVKPSLSLSDTEIGVVLGAFMIVYTLASPIFGSLGDRKSRPPLIAAGVFVWSLATAAASFATGFWSLFAARAAVGVGEAAYGTIAPPLLADHFRLENRGRALATFFAAIPIGAAAAYVIGGILDHHFGWRTAFLVAGIPGLLLGVLVLRVVDPPRGSQDGLAVAGAPEVRRSAYGQLIRNRTYVLAVLGYAAYTFALGGLANWMPAFLERTRGMPREQATVAFGVITLVTGFAGTFAGGWLGDRLLRRTRHAYLWVSGLATIVAAPLTWLALSHPRPAVYLTAIAGAEMLTFMCTGPVNSAIVNAVAPGQRATAIGLSVFVMHFLGDIPSPPLIGWISDASSLEQAFLVVPAAVLLAGIIWTYAAVSTE